MPREAVPEARAGSYYFFELIGCRCVDERDGDLGAVVEVVADGGGWLLEVEARDGESGRRIALPFVEEFVCSTSIARAGRIDWRLPERTGRGVRFQILTIFPELFGPFIETSSSAGRSRGASRGGSPRLARVSRCDRHRSVDDEPYGGGGGMVMDRAALDPRRGGALRRPQAVAHPPLTAGPAARRSARARARDAAGAASGYSCAVGMRDSTTGRSSTVVDEEVSVGDFVSSRESRARRPWWCRERSRGRSPGLCSSPSRSSRTASTPDCSTFRTFHGRPRSTGRRVPGGPALLGRSCRHGALPGGNRPCVDPGERRRDLLADATLTRPGTGLRRASGPRRIRPLGFALKPENRIITGLGSVRTSAAVRESMKGLVMTRLIDVEQSYLRQTFPEFRAGDTVRVQVRVEEGDEGASAGV